MTRKHLYVSWIASASDVLFWPSFEEQDVACWTDPWSDVLIWMNCVLQRDTPGVSVQWFLDGVSFSKSFRKYQGHLKPYRNEYRNDADQSFTLLYICCSCCTEALSSIFCSSQCAAALWPISRERYSSHRMLTQGGTVLKEERSERESWLVCAGWYRSCQSNNEQTLSWGQKENFTHAPS